MVSHLCQSQGPNAYLSRASVLDLRLERDSAKCRPGEAYVVAHCLHQLVHLLRVRNLLADATTRCSHAQRDSLEYSAAYNNENPLYVSITQSGSMCLDLGLLELLAELLQLSLERLGGSSLLSGVTLGLACANVLHEQVLSLKFALQLTLFRRLGSRSSSSGLSLLLLRLVRLGPVALVVLGLGRLRLLVGGGIGTVSSGSVDAAELTLPLELGLAVRVVDPLEQVRGLAELVAGEDVNRKLKREGAGGSVELLENVLGRLGHEGVEDGSQGVDEVDRVEADLAAALGVLGEERIVEAAVLEVLVSTGRQRHGQEETVSQLGRVHGLLVLLKLGIDVLVELGVDLCSLRAVAGSLRNLATLGVGRSRNNRVELGVDKLDDTVDEVTEVGKQLAVHGTDKLGPLERAVASLRTVRDQVVAPNRGRLSNLRSLGTEDADVPALAELGVLVVQVLCWSVHVVGHKKLTGRRNVVKLRPVTSVGDQHGGEEDSVEVDV